MKIRFWGTRGSLPASITAKDIRSKIKAALSLAVEKNISPKSDLDTFIERHLPFGVRGTYGTNTSCVEIGDGGDFVLCDAGSGLRDFAKHYLEHHDYAAPMEFHIFISHIHWDHIQGFPFFIPIYIDGTRITLYGCHEDIKEAFFAQQKPPFFPVDFRDLNADIKFVSLTPGKSYEIAGFKVTAKRQNHPGDSYGYRFESGGKIVVYSTDSEHKTVDDENSELFAEFFRNADLLIFDAQYTLAEALTIKEDWGHSSNVMGVEFALKANVKHLCLFHQEPVASDEQLDQILQDTQRLSALLNEGQDLKVSIAWDGMVVRL